MIDFDEEIKKFKPNLEVDEAEEAIYKSENAPDVADLINKLVNGMALLVARYQDAAFV